MWTMLRNRGAIIGAIIGVAAAVLVVLPARAVGELSAFSVILVLAIALVGLGLGARAATVAYVASSATLIGFTITSVGSPQLLPADALRLGVFVAGATLIVILVRRAELDRGGVVEAREAAEAAHGRAEAERHALALARGDVDVALVRAERERARLEEVAEAIPEPLIVYDDGLRGTYGNRAALRLFGRSFFEREIDEWGRVAEPRDEHGDVLPRDEWPQVRAQQRPIRQRMTLRVPMSGRSVHVDVEGTPIPGGGCVLLLRDVGKEEDERRRLSRFASFVAHELRNPLAVAKARIELAQRDSTVPHKPANHVERARESVDAAIAILERLELYSRADAGGIEARREPFQLLRAAEAAVERLRIRGSERSVSVLLPDGVHVVGDRYLAEQAITNLLTNAERYSQPGAPIRIEVTDGELVTLRVIDAGPGIADDVAERLFRDRVAAGRGLGLGLYLVHATMEAMGGTVLLEQRRPQAIFALRWPRARDAPPD